MSEYVEKHKVFILKSKKLQRGEEFIGHHDFYENAKRVFLESGDVKYLHDFCRVEKKIFGLTSRCKEMAQLAWENKKNENTLWFLLEMVIPKLSTKEAEEYLHRVFLNVKNKRLLTVKNIYMAGILERKGFWSQANNLIERFKFQYNGKLWRRADFLVTNPFLVSDLNYLSEPEFKNSHGELAESNVKRYDYAVSVSCNLKYFDLYGESFLRGCVNLSDKTAVFLTVVNFDEEAVFEAASKAGVVDKVYVNKVEVSDSLEVPVSALYRMYQISSILKIVGKGVAFTEFDGFIKRDFSSIFDQKQDVLVRVGSSYLPWKRYTCGFGVVRSTIHGMSFAYSLKKMVSGLFAENKDLMWADQAVLESAIRLHSLIDYGFSYKTTNASLLSMYLLTPTGSLESKIKKLNAAASIVNPNADRLRPFRQRRWPVGDIQVIGLQRSGTNFLAEVLAGAQNHYQVVKTGDNRHFWKHALPSDLKNGSQVREVVENSNNLFLVLVSKHPLSWLESIIFRNPADLAKRRPFVLNEDGKIDALKGFTFYLEYHRSWISFSSVSNLVHVKYEDLLDNLDSSVDKIGSVFGFDSSSVDPESISVKFSRGSYYEKRRIYQSPGNNLPEDLVVEMRASLSEEDEKLLTLMGYSL